MLDGFTIFTDELDRQSALAGEFEVSRAILVAESMTANDDWLRPAWNQTRNVLADDWFAEDNATENVTDGAVWRLPHLLELEFFNAGFVRRDGCAFYADAVLFDGVCSINGDLIVGLIAVFDRQIVIFQIDVEVWMDQLVLDELPDDAGHLIAVEFNDRVCNLDFCH